MDARVDRHVQGKRQTGVAGAEGNDARSWVLLVAAQYAVLDVVEREVAAADGISESESNIINNAKNALPAHAMLSKKPPETDILSRSSLACMTRQLYLNVQSQQEYLARCRSRKTQCVRFVT